MANIKCKWCGYEFKKHIASNEEGERMQLRCEKCLRFIPSSIKEPTDNVNRRHIHRTIK